MSPPRMDFLNFTSFTYHDFKYFSADGTVVGWFVHAENRFQWNYSYLGADVNLLDAIEDEASIYKDWASKQETNQSEEALPNLTTWLSKNTYVHNLILRLGISFDLQGRSILEIGGCGKDSKYFISSTPNAICQVEISSESQLLLQRRFSKSADFFRNYFQLHTCPAEFTPFVDGAFDFIFSRATIHHCKRPKIFNEILRLPAIALQ